MDNQIVAFEATLVCNKTFCVLKYPHRNISEPIQKNKLGRRNVERLRRLKLYIFFQSEFMYLETRVELSHNRLQDSCIRII